ncbi:MAG: radical SAM protein [Desulfoprunum sp.]|uniref:radical SAM protein n=1 Tax=Desulfoprunum sp. TaxID=2020866 RepID=UPI003C791640
MHYEGTVIRPPSEAFSIILQVTVGCSYNKCTFCGAFKDKRFRVKTDEEIDDDLRFASQHCRRQNRVFLADGDVLILPQHRLSALLGRIRASLPWVKKISLYGNARSIRSKTVADLAVLKGQGLDRIYMGLESGCDEVLERIHKGETAATMIETAQRVNDSGLFLSATILLGLGGIELSEIHARQSAAVLNRMAPRQVAALTLMPLPNTLIGRQYQSGLFRLPDQLGILRELRTLVTGLELSRSMFHANHASNYLPIEGVLSKDKHRILAAIELALAGHTPLVPDNMRAL